MSLHGRDRDRIETDQTKALSHPVRIGILGLFTRDTDRSLAAADLLADLIEEDPAAFGRLDAGQVLYHRARLQDAELIPVG
jgi:hypothetical protein